MVDNLMTISTLCKKYDLWFHIDDAYGIPAAVIPELKEMLEGVSEAHSIALSPHKWFLGFKRMADLTASRPKWLY